MIKCEYKTFHAFVFVLLFLTVFTAIVLYYLKFKSVEENFSENTAVEVAKSIILTFLMTISISKLISLKSIEIKNNTVTIKIPFKFTVYEYKLSDLSDIKVKVIRTSGANGPAYIEKPYKVIFLYFNNGKKYRFSSKSIKNFNQLETFCQSINTN